LNKEGIRMKWTIVLSWLYITGKLYSNNYRLRKKLATLPGPSKLTVTSGNWQSHFATLCI